MKSGSPKYLLLLVSLFLSPLLLAQPQLITVTGQVSDQGSGQAIEFATVMLKDPATDQLITGTTTATGGSFTIQTKATDFYIEVTFIGLQPKTIREFTIENGIVNLGVIELVSNSEMLDEVVVRSERSKTEFKLDKRVFNVGEDLSSTGASALEVLNNVPSVNVNIEGEISLRGSSGVQILINGKPSVLASEQGNALGTITADMIEKIEVITNPSAKYEAEGTSGIINIVIKKEERKGLNGSLSVNTGFPQNHSVGLSLNRRTERFNLFSQLGVGHRELPRQTENINRNLVTGTTISTTGMEYRNETFYNVILGTDYLINKYNILTLSGNFAYEIEDQPSLTLFDYFNGADSTRSIWFRDEVTEATNPKWQYELQYKKDFEDNEDRFLLFSALGNFFGKDQSSVFNHSNVRGEEVTPDQLTRTNFQEARYTFKLDYTHPFTEKITLETGAQYFINNVSNDFEVQDLIDGEWVADPNQTNIFEFDQKVLGVYSTGAYEGDKWGVKVGLRVEHTDLKTLLITTDVPNDQNYLNLFPSFHTSYKISEAVSVQAGYSRRIYRPRLWDLNPFFNIRNNFSIRAGNPELQPEFTDSYEINSIYIFGELSMNLGVYHRYTNEVIERVSFFEDDVNLTKPINLGNTQTTGIEYNFKYTPAKWFTMNGDINYNYFLREGTFDATSFDFSADQWSSKLNAKFKLPADIDMEITGQYLSGVRTVQGRISENYFADFGFRKKIMKGKAVLSIGVRDIFASRIRESVADQDRFFVYRFGQSGRFITAGFSFGFGKGEAMEYSGRRRYH
jgi:outer membrane receptor protein involved in Fe transport